MDVNGNDLNVSLIYNTGLSNIFNYIYIYIY